MEASYPFRVLIKYNLDWHFLKSTLGPKISPACMLLVPKLNPSFQRRQQKFENRGWQDCIVSAYDKVVLGYIH